jgi:hypothetical protein
MSHPAIDTLARFCADQRQAFESNAWLNCEDADRRTIAVVAKYLSCTSWYGHEDELDNIATVIDPNLPDDLAIGVEAEELGFDLTRFSANLRYRIALQRVQQTA